MTSRSSLNISRQFNLLSEHLALVYLTNKEATTVLCSVVKHAGSDRARKKCRGKYETQSSVSPYFLSVLLLASLHCV